MKGTSSNYLFKEAIFTVVRKTKMKLGFDIS